MKKFLKNLFFAGAFIFLVASPIVVVTTPQPASAQDAVSECESRLFGIPPWYRGLTNVDPNLDGSNDCIIKSPDEVGGLSSFIWKIVLNIIEIGLVVAGWIALFFVMYGAFLYITGGSNATQTEKARKSIFNAVIGLIISMGAIAITNLTFGLVDGATSPNEYGIPEIQSADLLRSGINLAYYIAGIVAVIVIIIAGIMYVTSLGDSSRVTKAKNMILYAVIGIIVLIAAFAITNFVMDRF